MRVTRITLKKKQSKERGKEQAQKALNLFLGMYHNSDSSILTKEGKKLLMQKVNEELAKEGLGPYMLVQGPNKDTHMRLKKPNRKMKKRK